MQGMALSADDRRRIGLRLADLTHQLHKMSEMVTYHPLAERVDRLIWLYLFHIGVLASGIGQPRTASQAYALVEWMQHSARFDEIPGTAIKRRLDQFAADIEHLLPAWPLEPGPVWSPLPDWWLDQVLVVEGALDTPLQTTLRQYRVLAYFVSPTLPLVLRAARLIRPHLVLLNGKTPGMIPQWAAILRDDRRLDLSELWMSVPSSAHWRSPPEIKACIDGVIRVPGSARQITRLHHAIQEINRRRDLALIDAATGLHSMGYLRQRLTEEVLRQGRYGGTFGLITLTWNPWLWLTDSPFEHPQESYDLLHRVADHLRASVRHSDVVAFDGVGRFYVAIFDIAHQHLSRRLAAFQHDLKGSLQFPFFGNQPVLYTAMAAYPNQGEVAEDLLAYADRALWYAIPGWAGSFKPSP